MRLLNNTFTRILGSTILATLCMLNSTSTIAQPSEYQRLAFQNDQPNIFVDVFPLPGKNDDSVELTTIFNISNKFLTFRKLNNSNRDAEFFSTSKLTLEVFKSPKKDLRPNKQVDVKQLESIGRSTWSDTAYAASYEQTQSNKMGLNGAMQVTVKPGYYTYLLQLTQDQSQKRRNSQTRNIYIAPYDQENRHNIILGKSVDSPSSPSRLHLLAMGNNVTYGEDFYAMIPLPNYQGSNTYTLTIDRVERSRDDTTQIEEVFNHKISSQSVYPNIQPELLNGENQLSLSLKTVNDGYSFALVRIPNSKFPNASYRMRVTNEETSQPVAQRLFQSYWSDIPTSLLSLDVAIDMLRFMTDNETIDHIDSGSDRERERKFREFWSKKDPTPNTEYNELQAEYYTRIDYAYENFGSQNELGFNTDRGKVYINYGPPNNTKRTFPSDGATTEVWTYNNRRFIFKATSGFGDFQLVSQSK